MAFADWNLGGLTARVKFRLQTLPKYTTAIVRAAIKKAVVRLLLYTRDVSTIYNAETYVLTAGEDAGKYAQEYELPDNTLVVDSLSFDGQRPLKVLSQHEYAATGADDSIGTGDPTDVYFYNTPERTKIAVLVPRPNRVAQLQFFGVIEPNWINTTTEATTDASVPPFTEDASDTLESYSVQYLSLGQPGEEARTELAKKEWKDERAEFKFNLGINRVGKTRRERDI